MIFLILCGRISNIPEQMIILISMVVDNFFRNDKKVVTGRKSFLPDWTARNKKYNDIQCVDDSSIEIVDDSPHCVCRSHDAPHFFRSLAGKNVKK
jgi:hypothetical protein